jgi:peptide/nickel transport system substrate-binding protein
VGIIPKHIFEAMPVDAIRGDPHSAAQAFGTGPFMVASMTKNPQLVTLKRNPYTSPQPLIEKLAFRSYGSLDEAASAISRGDVDVVGGLLPPQATALARRQEVRLLESRTFSFVAIFFNLATEKAPYAEPALRQGLVQVLDKRRLIQEILAGKADPGTGPIPSGDWAYARDAAAKYPFDLAAGQRSLDASGWTLAPQSELRSRNGERLTLSLVTPDAYPYREVADSISLQLRAVGVDVKVDPVPASVLVGRYLVGKRYQLALAAIDNGPDPDQYTLWHSGAPKESLNFANLPRQHLIDKDLEDGRSAVDRRARLAAYEDFQDLMSDAAPAIFLYEPHYVYAVGARLRGVKLRGVVQPEDRFQTVASWYVQTRSI